MKTDKITKYRNTREASAEAGRCSDHVDFRFLREDYFDAGKSEMDPVYIKDLKNKAARNALSGLYKKASRVMYELNHLENLGVEVILTVNSLEYANDGIMDLMKEFSVYQEAAKKIVKEMGWEKNYALMDRFDKIWEGEK